MGYKNHINFFFQDVNSLLHFMNELWKTDGLQLIRFAKPDDFQGRLSFNTPRFYLYLYAFQHNKSRSVDQSPFCWGLYICTTCGPGALLWTKFSLDWISALHIWFEAVQRPSQYFGPLWPIRSWSRLGAYIQQSFLCPFLLKESHELALETEPVCTTWSWSGVSLQNLTAPHQLVTEDAAQSAESAVRQFQCVYFQKSEKRHSNSQIFKVPVCSEGLHATENLLKIAFLILLLLKAR